MPLPYRTACDGGSETPPSGEERMAKTNREPSAPAQEPLILLIPGLDGSGPGHWQRRWAEEIDNAQMVDLGLWEKPHRNTWINRLNHSVQRAGRPVVLVAHSLGCLLVGQVRAAGLLLTGRGRPAGRAARSGFLPA